MQFRKSGQGFAIGDRRTAVTAASLGAFLVLTGIAIATAGIIRAGEASGSVVIETVIFGFAATAFGAFLFRTGVRAFRRLRATVSHSGSEVTAPRDLDRAA